jgi:hypothetical protein
LLILPVLSQTSNAYGSVTLRHVLILGAQNASSIRTSPIAGATSAQYGGLADVPFGPLELERFDSPEPAASVKLTATMTVDRQNTRVMAQFAKKYSQNLMAILNCEMMRARHVIAWWFRFSYNPDWSAN